MLEKFRQNLFIHLKISPDSRILVAVSGGMDSVALLHLLKSLDLQVGVAHVNFQLRGDESDSDESLVKNLAIYYGSPFYVIRFDTKTIARQKGLSTQMAARKLRYEWFDTIASNNAWNYVATAHHLDDQIETFFINLMRGTGISGLKGIPPATGNLIRPLLPFYRSELEEYVKNNQLRYREDSSNQETDYLRNRIRHKLLPMIEEMQPAFRKIMAGNLLHLADAEGLFRKTIEERKKEVLLIVESGAGISIPNLLKSGNPELLLLRFYRNMAFQAFRPGKYGKLWSCSPVKPSLVQYTV